MKVLLINGSPHPKGCTFTALSEVAKTLNEENIDTEIIYLGTKPVAGCIACGYCREHGCCFRDDAVKDIQQRLDEYDGLIIGSPVYYSQPTGQVLSFCQRLFFGASGRWAGKLGAAVVSCRRGGATATFETINQIFMMNNMPVVTSQYWNQVHGNTPEEVKQDKEGLQTMRTLGKNMAWLLKLTHGHKVPDYEPKVFTNFIR